MCVTSVVPPDRNFPEQRSAARAAANCLTFHWNSASSHASHTIARFQIICWAEARIKVARMTLTIELDGNWNSFQLANSAPQLSVTDSAIAPSARMLSSRLTHKLKQLKYYCDRSSKEWGMMCDIAVPASFFSAKETAHTRFICCPFALLVCESVTPKGALRPAVCHASATREGS